MPTYKAPVDDALFCSTTSSTSIAPAIYPALPTHLPMLWKRYCARPPSFSEEVLTPLNRVGDKEGCQTPPLMAA